MITTDESIQKPVITKEDMSNNWVVVVEDEIIVPPDDINNNNTVTMNENNDDANTNQYDTHTKEHVPIRTSTTSPITSNASSTNIGNGNGGLSELSKQLRILQCKNQNQVLEIDKLQRQLRILAELQNISVNDLRSALEKACEAEAYNELQTRIISLRAELEVAAIANTITTTSSSMNGSTTIQPKQNPDEMNHAKIIANLELRIGELEELEDQHRKDIERLYIQLTEKQDTTSKLQSLCDQLRSENELLKLHHQQQTYTNTLLQQKLLLQQQEQQQAPNVAVVVEDNTKELEQQIQKLQEMNVTTMGKVREADTWSRIVTEKLKLCEQQRDTLEKESTLRNAQYKARFIVQEENIEDLRQQLVSLYTAFELVKEEKDRDDATRVALQSLLGSADAEVARQVDEIDHSMNQNNNSNHRQSFIASPIVKQSPNSMKKSPFSLSKKRNDSIVNVVEPDSPYINPTLQATLNDSVPLIASDLLIKDTKGVLKKWRKKYVRLYATVSHFHLDIDDEDKGYAIQIGVSHIELYDKYPMGFTIYMGDKSNITLYLAATNEKDYSDWITILSYATTGSEINTTDDEILLPISSSSSTTSSFQSPTQSSSTTTTTPTMYTTDDDKYDTNNYYQPQHHQQQQRGISTNTTTTTTPPQEELDLQYALELSEREYKISQRDFS